MVTTNGDLQERLQRFGLMIPIDPDAANRWRPAARLDTLHGKVGGFLGNRKANASLLLHNVRELLDKNLELGDSMAVDKYVYSRPAADDIIDQLATQCDFVVTAIADWGSCTACSVHDAMTLENLGVPTVVLCTDPFMNSAFRHATSFGRRDFRPLGFPHPLGGLTPDMVAVRAGELEQAVIETLTTY